MAKLKCPGMNPANFQPQDIKTHNCIHCGMEMEFWKDDIKIRCPACNQFNFNPGLGNTCLTWCKSAADCLGNNNIHEWMQQNKAKQKGE